MTFFFDRWIPRFGMWAVSRPLVVLGAVLAAAFAGLPGTVRLFSDIRTDFAALLPEDDATVRMVEETIRRFGTVKNLIVIFRTRHKEAIPRLFADLERGLRELPEVKNVRYRKPGYDFFRARRLLYLGLEDLKELRDRLKAEIDRRKLGALYLDFEEGREDFSLYERIERNGAFIAGGNLASPFLTNADEDVFLFEVFPSAETGVDVAYSRAFFRRISGFLDRFDARRYAPDLEISYSGGVKGVMDEYEAVMRDIKMAGLISWGLIGVLVLQYFRSVRLSAAAFFPLITGMATAFGLARLAYGQLNMITAFIFSVLAGVGIENGIHLSTRYFEARRAGESPDGAARTMLATTGRAAFMAALTTAGTMIVLVPSGFRGFSEFGGIMALGILVIFAFYVMALPPILTVMDRRGWIHAGSEAARHLVDPLFFMKGWDRPRHIRTVLVAGSLVTLASLWMLSQTRFDDDFASLKAANPETDAAHAETDAIYRAKSFPSLMLVADAAEASTAKEAILARNVADPTPTVDRVITYNDLVPPDQGGKLKLLREIGGLLDDDALNALEGDEAEEMEDLRRAVAVEAFTHADIPEEASRIFYGKTRRGDEQFVFVSPRLGLDLERGRDALAFAEDTRDVPVGGGIRHAVSHNLIFADLMTRMTSDMRTVLFWCAAAAFAILWLDFRSIVTTLIVLLPLALGILWIFGVTLGGRWPTINLFNIVVIPCLIGMSIDNATHVFYRLRESGMAGMVEVLRHTGNSVIMSVLTAVAGFAGLLAAGHPGLHSTGHLAFIGLATTLASGLGFFPALLEWLHRRGVRM